MILPVRPCRAFAQGFTDGNATNEGANLLSVLERLLDALDPGWHIILCAKTQSALKCPPAVLVPQSLSQKSVMLPLAKGSGAVAERGTWVTGMA